MAPGTLVRLPRGLHRLIDLGLTAPRHHRAGLARGRVEILERPPGIDLLPADDGRVALDLLHRAHLFLLTRSCVAYSGAIAGRGTSFASCRSIASPTSSRLYSRSESSSNGWSLCFLSRNCRALCRYQGS